MVSTLFAVLALLTPGEQDINIDAAATLLMVISGDRKAEQLVGKMGDAELRKQYGVSTDTRLSSQCRNIFSRLLNTTQLRKDGRNYEFTLLENSEINALALPGGNIYLFDGLARLSGITPDEIASVIGHEIGHVNCSHGLKQMRESLGLGVLVSLLSKDESVQKLTSALRGLYTASNSRSHEYEADKIGFQAVVEAGYRSTAPLAFMRRLQTLESQRDPIGELFATHPRSEDRAKRLKTLHFEHRYGKIHQTLVADTTQKAGTVKEYAWSDPAWQTDYTTLTGGQVYDLENYFSRPNGQGKGQCTWLVQGLRADEIPRCAAGTNNAHTWFDRCREAGYGVGKDPKPLSIAVWNNKVGGGAGHVAVVGSIISSNLVGIWDANWGRKQPDLKVRYRIIDRQAEKNLMGFIYWPNGQMERPGSAAGPQEVVLLNQEVYLGDDEQGAITLWDRVFELTAADLHSRRTAKITLELRAVPKKDPIISINGQEVGRIVAESEQWRTYETPSFSIGLLRQGKNLIDIETIILSAQESFDDCLIRRVALVLD